MSDDVAPESRAKLAAELRGKYEAGDTVRQLASEYELSYGSTYDLLRRADTRMRARSGSARDTQERR